MYSVSSLRKASSIVLFLLAFGSIAGAQDRPARRHPQIISSLATTSPFSPPKANDYTFVIDSGAGLDTGCSFRSDGPLVITLPVGRVLGDLAKLKANGLVPENVRLEFPAFDVDSAGAPGLPPELDRVSVNGNVVPGEFMTGINNVWVMQRFDIPIEWLNLPDEPPARGTVTPADNEIRIDIDTASGADENWCTAVDWVTITIDNPIPPRPWIGAHGIFSDSSIWNGLWVPGVRNLGIPADPGPDMGRLDSIQSNAGKIANAVSAARARWGVDRVNIVAHSKGGLDSREFTETSTSVEKLVQLGTPNAGSPLADAIQSGSISLLGIGGNIVANLLAGGVGGYQLTTTYMAGYNHFHGFNPKVSYMAIGGLQTPGGWFSDPGGKILEGIVGPGDLIVPLSSVHALPYTDNRTVFSTFPPTFGPASHTQIHQNPTAFAIAGSLIKAPGLSSSSLASGSVMSSSVRALRTANAASNPTLQHAQTFGGKLQQPQTATHTVAVDSATTLAFTLLHPEGDLDLKLTDPNGQVFDATTIIGRSDVSRQEAEIPGGFIEVYAFTGSFVPGNWTATVTAKNTNGPVDYNLIAWLDSAPLQMTTAVDKLSVPVGGSFVLSATLRDGTLPVTGATVNAAVLLPDGITLKKLVLSDNGSAPDTVANDGIYTARFSETTQAGPYGIAVDASGTTSGTPFTREAYLSNFATASSSTILTGLHDSGRDLNGNGLFDQLVLEVPVQITASGTYRLAATLADSSGNVLETSDSFNLTPASTSVELVFDGATLFAHGVNGPYQITSVRMAEERNQVILPLTETNSTFSTSPYLFTQFEGAKLALTGTNSAAGVDTNGNGKFDLLQTDIGVNVRTAGFYQWSARLRDRNGHEITLASNSGNLSSGLSSIRLSFDGSAIGRNGVNGPFNVTDLILFSTSDTLSVANVFSSPPLAASDFEGFVAPAVTVQFSSGNYTAFENQHSVQITVTRSGLTSGAVSVNYHTADGTASERSDYTPALGTLDFAPGETSKTFDLLITDDAYVESNETFSIALSDPTGGGALGAPDIALVTIVSDDANASAFNPIDDPEFFVRQHYHDFLNREPDASGLQFWVNNITSCGADAACREVKRVDTSAAFFLSIEFQNTGFFAYRVQKAAFGNLPGAPVPIRLTEFLSDTQSLGHGVVVGQGLWQRQLESNKQSLALAVVQRPDFQTRYPNITSATAFVNILDANAGGVLTSSDKEELIRELSPNPADAALRADVLKQVSENPAFVQAEFTRAFDLMEYFAYLRRDPDAKPDVDFTGYQFWLDKLERSGGNFSRAEMIKAFISATEYRERFNSR
jgi:hypothetical protein